MLLPGSVGNGVEYFLHFCMFGRASSDDEIDQIWGQLSRFAEFVDAHIIVSLQVQQSRLLWQEISTRWGSPFAAVGKLKDDLADIGARVALSCDTSHLETTNILLANFLGDLNKHVM